MYFLCLLGEFCGDACGDPSGESGGRGGVAARDSRRTRPPPLALLSPPFFMMRCSSASVMSTHSESLPSGEMGEG